MTDNILAWAIRNHLLDSKSLNDNATIEDVIEILYKLMEKGG